MERHFLMARQRLCDIHHAHSVDSFIVISHRFAVASGNKLTIGIQWEFTFRSS